MFQKYKHQQKIVIIYFPVAFQFIYFSTVASHICLFLKNKEEVGMIYNQIFYRNNEKRQSDQFGSNVTSFVFCTVLCRTKVPSKFMSPKLSICLFGKKMSKHEISTSFLFLVEWLMFLKVSYVWKTIKYVFERGFCL